MSSLNGQCKDDSSDGCSNNKKKYSCFKPVAGEVAGTLTSVGANTTVRLPLNFRLFRTSKVRINEDGGIRVEEDGEYFVAFSAVFPNNIFGVIFSVYSPDFSGTAITGNGATVFSELVCLEKGDTVYVTVTTGITPIPAPGIAGILTVVKVED